MSEWIKALLGDIAQIQTGPFGSQLHASDYQHSGIPVIMPTNIRENLTLDCTNIAYITEADAHRLQRYLLQQGDIVYSRRGAVQRCAFITPNESGWLCGTGCLRVRFNPTGIYPLFFAYYFSTNEIQDWVIGNTVGTTMPNLNSKILEQLPIVIPPLSEQQAIADVLSSLDAKIDLLRRQNTTLEAMAETLFRQWFTEEDDALSDLIPIKDILEFNPSRPLKKAVIAPYVEMAALSTTQFNPSFWYKRPFSSGIKFMNGDTLLARITPCLENGKSAFITFLDENQIAWGSTEYIVMRPKISLHPFFAYALARNEQFRAYATGCLAGSSGRQRVDLQHLIEYQIKQPSTASIHHFNAFAESAVSKLHHNAQQIQTLEHLRDILLPKLMSGDIGISTGVSLR